MKIAHHPAIHSCSPYVVNASVEPKVRVVLDGHRPNYDAVDDERGVGRHKVLPFLTEFKLADEAVYSGYNFCYFGRIVSIGPKLITIESGCMRRRLTIQQFAFWNRRDVRFVRDERASWSD